MGAGGMDHGTAMAMNDWLVYSTWIVILAVMYTSYGNHK
jgi:hypothetical protein